MGQKRFAKEPLLYIQNPNIQKPEARMQEHYYTPKKNKQHRPDDNDANTTKPQKRNRTLPLKRTYFSDLLEDENEIPKDEERDEEDADMLQNEDDTIEKNQSFKGMTLIERVHYFLNIPEHIPKMKCMIETEDNRYRGMITDFKDNIVFMQTGSRLLVSKRIPFESIKSIQIIGF